MVYGGILSWRGCVALFLGRLSLFVCVIGFFFSSRRRHTRWPRDWSSDVCSSDLGFGPDGAVLVAERAEQRFDGPRVADRAEAPRGVPPGDPDGRLQRREQRFERSLTDRDERRCGLLSRRREVLDVTEAPGVLAADAAIDGGRVAEQRDELRDDGRGFGAVLADVARGLRADGGIGGGQAGSSGAEVGLGGRGDRAGEQDCRRDARRTRHRTISGRQFSRTRGCGCGCGCGLRPSPISAIALAALRRTDTSSSFNALVSASSARASPISASAWIARRRTSGLLSATAATSASTALLSPISPSEAAACARTLTFSSVN